jgi:hypothetical protein
VTSAPRGVPRRRGQLSWLKHCHKNGTAATNPATTSRAAPLGDGLFELRRNQVRLFYIFEPGQIIRLLGGIVKKQDRIPPDVLAQMRGYQKDARERLKKAKTEKKR